MYKCYTIREARIWFMSPHISYMCFFYRQPILQSTLLLVVMSSHILSLHQSSTSPMPYEEMP